MVKLDYIALLAIAAVVAISGLDEPEQKPAAENDEMSKRTKRFIVEGDDATPHEFPWTVYLYTRYKSGREGDCTGSLISPRIVLTAAHCVKYRNRTEKDQFDAQMVAVFPGWHKNPKKEIVAKKNIPLFDVAPITSSNFSSPPLPKQHTNYSYYDYSVIILKQPLKPNKTIGFIKFADTKSPPARQLICYSAGFGTTGVPNNTIANKLFNAYEFIKLQQYYRTFWPDVLQKERFKIQTAKRCYQLDKAMKMKNPNATEEQVNGIMRELKKLGLPSCGMPVRESAGICHGDSGGPLMCRRESGPWVLYGVTSGGYGSCVGLSFFSSVSKISKWLKQIVNTYDPGFLATARPNGRRTMMLDMKATLNTKRKEALNIVRRY